MTFQELRYRHDGLAAIVERVAERVGASVAAAYLVPPVPHRVQLLAAGGPDAGRMGLPGEVDGAVDAFVRSRAHDRSPAFSPGTHIAPQSWRGHDRMGWIGIPVAAGTIAVIAVGGPTIPDAEELREAMVPVARLCIEPVPV